MCCTSYSGFDTAEFLESALWRKQDLFISSYISDFGDLTAACSNRVCLACTDMQLVISYLVAFITV